MKDTPFIYGSTVSNRSFTNREADIAKLQSNLLSGINTTIISPRRWGKSSLVEKVINNIANNEKNIRCVIIDLFSVSNEEEFLEIFAREVIKASSTKWQEWMNSGKDFFHKLIPKLSIGIDPATDFSLSFDWVELKKNSDEVLNLPETIAQKKGVKFIICLDEFQNLAPFRDFLSFEKKLRASWQRHKLVTYCLFGSKRHMMADIFNNPAKPFYRFGDIMILQKIETEKWIRYICKGFEDTGKQIDEETAGIIPRLMKNHSWYIQQLAHYTWNVTQNTATTTEIKAALKELLNANIPLYQNETEGISYTQLNLLKAVAKGETQFTSAAVMQKYLLGTPRNVSKNKSLLINNDIIHEVNNRFEFVDPAFELWFKKQFFNQSFSIEQS
ncbi:MAG: ATP-binding protein [Bacteroidota bacterium]|nr:ATP-binding protein [Bacteroidota bacterium]